MKFKSAFLSAVVIAGLFTCAARAAPTWSFSVNGTIDSGTDYTGAFGTVGQDLSGLKFLETVTTSVNPADYTNAQTSASSKNYSGNFSGFLVTATVNGKTISETVMSQAWGQQYITNAASAGIRGNDTVSTNQYGFDAAGNQIFANLSAYTGDPSLAFVSTLDFGQVINAGNPGLSPFASFEIANDGYALVAFSGTPTSFLVNGAADDTPPPSNVPEPASLALFCLGFVGTGALHRRKAS